MYIQEESVKQIFERATNALGSVKAICPDYIEARVELIIGPSHGNRCSGTKDDGDRGHVDSATASLHH